MNRWDLAVVALAAVLVGASFAWGYAPRVAPTHAVVATRSGERLLLPLATPTTRTITGRHGPTRIEVQDGRARVAASTCTQRLCVRAGWLTRSGDTAACLPNGVLLRLTGGRDPDHDAITG